MLTQLYTTYSTIFFSNLYRFFFLPLLLPFLMPPTNIIDIRKAPQFQGSKVIIFIYPLLNLGSHAQSGQNVSKLEKKSTLKQLTLNFWGRVVLHLRLSKSVVSCPALLILGLEHFWKQENNARIFNGWTECSGHRTILSQTHDFYFWPILWDSYFWCSYELIKFVTMM